MPDTSLIVHVKGTEETRTLPKQIVRAAIAQGQISRSQLIWSPIHNAWKQVRELPHLWPSQKLAPAPLPRATGTLPKVKPTGTLVKPSGTLPKIAAEQPQPGAAATPRVAVKATPVARAKASTSRSTVVEEEKGGFNPLKGVVIGLALLIVIVLAGNYFFVSQPLASKLGATPYGSVSAFAHLGAFVQPGALVIHVSPSSAVPKDKVVDFLVTLAHSTPQPDSFYERISLTTGWTSHYTLSGFAWKKLGDMRQESDEEKQNFLLSQLMDANGQPLFAPNPNADPAQVQAQREHAWNSLLTYFAGNN